MPGTKRRARVTVRSYDLSAYFFAEHQKLRWKDGHDFIIKVGSEEIPAHRKKLMKESSYFEAMLSHDMRESQSGVVVMKDVDVECVKKCVEFMYTRPVAHVILTYKECEKLLRVARIMLLDTLCVDITEFLTEKLSLDTFFHTKKIAYDNDCETLERECDQFAVDNFEKLFAMEEFGAFNNEYVEYLLTSGNCPTATVCKNLLLWVNLDINRRSSLFYKVIGTLDIHKMPPSYRKFLIESEPLVYNSLPVMTTFFDAILKEEETCDKEQPENNGPHAQEAGENAVALAPPPVAKKCKCDHNDIKTLVMDIDFFFQARLGTEQELEWCLCFLVENIDKLAEHDRFHDISPNLILDYIKSENFITTAARKLENLIRWVSFNPQKRHPVFEEGLALVDTSEIPLDLLKRLFNEEKLFKECIKCLKILALKKLDDRDIARCDPARKYGANKILFIGEETSWIYMYELHGLKLRKVSSFVADDNPKCVISSVSIENYVYSFEEDWSIRRLDVNMNRPRWEKMSALSNRWESKTYRVTAAVLSGIIYVVDGMSTKTSTVIYKFNPESGEVQNVDIDDEKIQLPCLVPAQGCLFCIGGFVKCNGKIGDEEFKGDMMGSRKVRKYNPSTDEWWLVNSMRWGRGQPQGGEINGKIIVVGGFMTSEQLHDTAEMYDVRADSWTVISLPLRSWVFPWSLTIGGDFFLFSGDGTGEADEEDPFPPYQLKVDMYDPERGCWVEVDAPPDTEITDSIVAVTL